MPNAQAPHPPSSSLIPGGPLLPPDTFSGSVVPGAPDVNPTSQQTPYSQQQHPVASRYHHQTDYFSAAQHHVPANPSATPFAPQSTTYSVSTVSEPRERSGCPDRPPGGGGVSNGNDHYINPPCKGQLSHQAQSSPTSGYDPDPYKRGSYTSQYAGAAGQQVRRKQVRATQACNHCRTRKQKCDEVRPCQYCRENSFNCHYNDVPPPKYVPISFDKQH